MATAGHHAEPFQAGRRVLVVALLLLAVFAWLVTDARMEGMDHGPGTDPGTLGFYVTAWVVMMAAMMFPSIAPMVLGYHRLGAGFRERGFSASTPLFVAGYLVSWTLFGLVAYGLFAAARSILGDEISWTGAGPYVAGGVIFAAALYQFTPAKDACLRRCRAPFAFLTDEWRHGARGALIMGAKHGAWCVGCCWGLMAALFAVGVMSVGWMVFVALMIAGEKLLPWRRVPRISISVLLAVLGLAVAFAPERVPGLTIPNSGDHMESMGTDGMQHP